MDDFARSAFREREAKRIIRRRAFWLHFAIWAATNVLLAVTWAITGAGFPWFLFPLLGWGIFVVGHGMSAFLFTDPNDVVLEREERRMRRLSSDT